jgi:hypothetical protein
VDAQPAADRVGFRSDQDGGQELYQKVATGTASEELLMPASAGFKVPTDWSADGRLLAFDVRSPDGANDIRVLSIPDQQATAFLVAPFHEAGGNFPPRRDLAGMATRWPRDLLRRPGRSTDGGGSHDRHPFRDRDSPVPFPDALQGHERHPIAGDGAASITLILNSAAGQVPE